MTIRGLLREYTKTIRNTGQKNDKVTKKQTTVLVTVHTRIPKGQEGVGRDAGAAHEGAA